jgi:hypothetical protein
MMANSYSGVSVMSTEKSCNVIHTAEGVANFLDLTPKAFANSSPGFERSEDPG